MENKKEITIFDNFFNDELFNEVKDYIENIKSNKNKEYETNHGMWGANLVKTSVPVLIYRFTSKDSLIYEKIKKYVEEKCGYFVSTFTLHMWPNLSYIPWHDDRHADAALSVYLNDTWESDWGGYLMYAQDGKIGAQMPLRNRAILQENHVQHCVSTINIGADMRYSLQFFLSKTRSVI